MAKIGTAHVEIKPVLNDEALEALTSRIADAVAEGVRRGYSTAAASSEVILSIEGPAPDAGAIARELRYMGGHAQP